MMAANITYKHLFDMLQRNGCTSITMPMSDLARFKKYATKNKMIDELNFETLNGAFVVTKINVSTNAQRPKTTNNGNK